MGLLDSERCLCGMHVHSAARLIAIKSMMLAVFKFCFLLFQLLYLSTKEKREHGLFVQAYNYLMMYYEHDHITTVELVICVALAAVSMLLFYGNRQNKPEFYYPFIIYSALEALQAIANVAMFIWLTYKMKYGNPETIGPDENRNQLFTYCIIIVIIFTVLYALRTYIFLVVITQAMLFLLKSRGQANSSRLTVPTSMSNATAENKMLPLVERNV